MKPSHFPLLFTPGPFNIPLRVRQAMVQEMGSRTPEFTRIYTGIGDLLRGYILNPEIEIQMIPGSGTETIEKLVMNFCHASDPVLVLENGHYGKRIEEIAKKWFKNVEVIHGDSFKPIDAEVIKRQRDLSRFRWGMLVHCETSSGVINDIGSICQVLHQNGVDTLVDTVSSFPFCHIPWEFISCAASTSGKWLWGPPGLGLAFIHSKLWKRPALRNCPISWDLRAQKESIEAKGQFRFTPPLPLFWGLLEALKLLEAEGPKKRWKRQQEISHQLDETLEGLDLKILGEKSQLIAGLRNVILPSTMSWIDLFEGLRSDGLVLYPGTLQPQSSFRICTWGDIQTNDLMLFKDSFLRLSKKCS